MNGILTAIGLANRAISVAKQNNERGSQRVLISTSRLDEIIQSLKKRDAPDNGGEAIAFLRVICEELRELYLFSLFELLDLFEITGNIDGCRSVLSEAKTVFIDDPLVFIASANFRRSFENDLQNAKSDLEHAIALGKKSGDFYMQANKELIYMLEKEDSIDEIEEILSRLIGFIPRPGSIDEKLGVKLLERLKLIGVDSNIIEKLIDIS